MFLWINIPRVEHRVTARNLGESWGRLNVCVENMWSTCEDQTLLYNSYIKYLNRLHPDVCSFKPANVFWKAKLPVFPSAWQRLLCLTGSCKMYPKRTEWQSCVSYYFNFDVQPVPLLLIVFLNRCQMHFLCVKRFYSLAKEMPQVFYSRKVAAVSGLYFTLSIIV